MITKNEVFKLLQDAWFKIERVIECQEWGTYPKQYKDLLLKEARQHDKLRPQDCKRGISLKEEVLLFAVQTLVRALRGDRKPVPSDFLHCKHSWLFAHALVYKYEVELRQALQGVDLAAIEALDYSKLIKA